MKGAVPLVFVVTLNFSVDVFFDDVGHRTSKLIAEVIFVSLVTGDSDRGKGDGEISFPETQIGVLGEV